MSQIRRTLVVVVLACVLVVAFRYHDVCRPLPRAHRVEAVADGHLRTGDLLLWTGGEGLRHVAEKFLVGPFTHVALVVRRLVHVHGDDDDDQVADATPELWVWESLAGCGKRFVRLAPLLRRRAVGERVVVRHLLRDQAPVGDGDLCLGLLAELIRTGRGTPYSFSFWRTAFHRWCAHLPLPPTTMRCTAHPRAPMFCSELVAYTLDMLGVLDVESHSGRTYDRLLPVDFSHDHAQRPLPLAPRFAYGPDVELLSDPRP